VGYLVAVGLTVLLEPGDERFGGLALELSLLLDLVE
jgi:hypothetical protein